MDGGRTIQANFADRYQIDDRVGQQAVTGELLGDRTGSAEHAAARDERFRRAGQRCPIDRLVKLFRVRGDDPHAGGRLDRLGNVRVFGPLAGIDAQQFDAGRLLFFPGSD